MNAYLIYVRGMIASLPAEDQATTHREAERLRRIISDGNEYTKLAAVLIIAELVNEDSPL